MATLPQIFDGLCGRLLKEMGYNLSPDSQIQTGFDKTGTKGSDRLVAEVRWTHRPMVYRRLLNQWVPTTRTLHLSEPVRRILMVSGTVEEQDIKWAKEKFCVELWGRNELIKKAPGSFKRVVRQYFDLVDAEVGSADEDIQRRRHLIEIVGSEISGDGYGKKLGGQLSQIDPGKEQAAAFEEICVKITNYLFRDMLVDPQTHPYLDDDLSVLDIIFRVSPNSGNEVWKTIARDFRTRVIVFECKNYSKAMGPLQVYTTERYLSLRALRSICFMLTRLPPKKEAVLAAHAAMRESGKLLVILHDDDLREMLKMRDRQLNAEPGSAAWVSNSVQKLPGSGRKQRLKVSTWL